MGKKKSFVNKKNSATFRLVYRDSPSTFSDPFGFLNDGERVFTRVDEGTSYVPGFTDDDPRANLEEGETDSIFADADEDSGEEANIRPKKDKYKSTHPIPHGSNNGQGQGPLPDHIRKEIIELGFPDDGYNYLMHMREIRASGGGSAFVPCRKPRLESIRPDVKAYDASNLQVSTCNEDDSNSNALYGVSSSTRYMRNVRKAVDPEVLAQLDKSDDSEFGSDVENLEEDFVVQANILEEEGGETSVRLTEIKQECDHANQSVSVQDEISAALVDDALQFSTAGDVVERMQRTPRLLDEQFELLALREYSDGDSEASDICDHDVVGAGNIHAPEIYIAMKEFLTNNLDFQDRYTVPADIRIDNISKNSSKNQDSATVHENTPVNDVISRCKAYGEMYANESQEEKEIVLVEDSSDNEDKAWDCETIVSTYSNLDNHPARIGAPQKPGRKDISQNSHRASDLKGPIISLRGKQQIPVDYLPRTGSSRKVGKTENTKAETSNSNSNVGGHSRTGETLEQKRDRKSTLKKEKREARMAKKELKTLYRDVSQHAQSAVAVAGPRSIHLM